MKKLLSNVKTVIVLFAVAILLLGFYVYMIARPISYNMPYHNSTVYEGETFEGDIEFYTDSMMSTKNTTFDEECKSYYYYKDGYVFFLMAENEEDYQEEVSYIDENFEIAIDVPFYASKVNAFKLVSIGPDGYTMVYTCTPAIVFAIVVGLVELALIGVSVIALILYKKEK